jgi:O-antigen ligase
MNPPRTLLPRFQSTMDHTAKWGAVALLLGVPTSIALVNIAILLILVGWCLSGQFRWKWDVIRHNPITWPALLLFGLVLVGMAYTAAPRAYMGSYLYVYSKLPLMLLLLTLLHEPRWRDRALAAFAVGSLITVGSTYANIWWEVPWSDTNNQGFGVNHNVFNDYIAQGLALAFFTALAVVHALEGRSRAVKLGWSLVAVVTVFSITHLLQGRTGQVVLLAMFLAMVLVAVPAVWRWRGLVAVLVLMVVLLGSSPLLRERIVSAVSEYTLYQSGGVVTTSIGARLDMWNNAIDMFLSSPLWGHGTGSYRLLSEQIYPDPSVCAVSCIHPHNQFLFFAAEFGLLGIVAYGWLIQRALVSAFGMARRDRILLVAFLAILFVDSFINGPLWVTTERHFFASMLPLLMAGWRARTDATTA